MGKESDQKSDSRLSHYCRARSSEGREERGKEDEGMDLGNHRLFFSTPTHILYYLTPGWEVKLG